MHANLFSLPKSSIDEIIRLEAEVMIPVLANSGIHITAENIASEIYKDQEQEIILSSRDSRPASWIRYSVKEDCVFVKCILLNQDSEGKGTLRGILRETAKALSEMKVLRIESVVQTANSTSILFHEKLGFQKLKENPKAIRYFISANVLKENLKRYRDQG